MCHECICSKALKILTCQVFLRFGHQCMSPVQDWYRHRTFLILVAHASWWGGFSIFVDQKIMRWWEHHVFVAWMKHAKTFSPSVWVFSLLSFSFPNKCQIGFHFLLILRQLTLNNWSTWSWEMDMIKNTWRQLVSIVCGHNEQRFWRKRCWDFKFSSFCVEKAACVGPTTFGFYLGAKQNPSTTILSFFFDIYYPRGGLIRSRHLRRSSFVRLGAAHGFDCISRLSNDDGLSPGWTYDKHCYTQVTRKCSPHSSGWKRMGNVPGLRAHTSPRLILAHFLCFDGTCAGC